MKKIGLLCLFAFFLLSRSSLNAQRYSHIIDQVLTEFDLRYMPDEELRVLKNEIIAIKGAAVSNRGATMGNPLSQNVHYLSGIDQQNIDLIERLEKEDRTQACSKEELFKLFYQLASTQKNMPLFVAQVFYGLSLDKEMAKHQKVVQLPEDLLAFWVPQFSTCEDCPYLNHFITINTQGEIISQLKVEGLLTVREDYILEIQAIGSSSAGTTTKPEYYQIMANGQLNFTGSQVVQAKSN